MFPIAHLDESSLFTSDFCSQMTQQQKHVDCLFASEPKVVATRRRRKMRAEAKKQRLNDEQVRFLEMSFTKERKLDSGRKVHLAAELGLDPKQVAVWFQNRRARWKNKKMEEELHWLKSMHDAVMLEKCHLENEVLKLKQRLSEAEEEIKKLAGGSPSSPLSVAARQVEEEAELMCMREYGCIDLMDWADLHEICW